MIEESLLNDLVKKYIGLPFIESSDKTRFDCWIFFKKFWRDLGYEWKREYRLRETVLRDDFSCGSDWFVVAFPNRLDSVFFQRRRKGKEYVYHSGIMLNSYEFIHCVKGAGVIISDLTNGWKERLAKIYRLKKNGCVFTNH